MKPGQKRDREEDPDQLARKVAEHYSNRTNQTREEREASPIIHLKKLNNWIKSVLIHLYAKRGDAVLDLGCGKGGDLGKWDKAMISYYVGVDIAAGSIEDARHRYNGETDHQPKRKDFNFPARLVCADCYEVPLDDALKDVPSFDICSCQFTLHYSWSTEERARQALHNVTSSLLPGGFFIGTMPDANVIVRKLRATDGHEFGNSVYRVAFAEKDYPDKKFRSGRPFGIQYDFHLEGAVDCPEWLVPFPKLVELADDYGLQLLMKHNFHEFVNEKIQVPEFGDLIRKLGVWAMDRVRTRSARMNGRLLISMSCLCFKRKGLQDRGRRPSREDRSSKYHRKMFCLYSSMVSRRIPVPTLTGRCPVCTVAWSAEEFPGLALTKADCSLQFSGGGEV